jgi:hypothetical protein
MVSFVLNPKVMILIPCVPSDASWSSAIDAVTCKVDGIVVSGVTGGSEDPDPDAHALSKIGTNPSKRSMRYLNRVDRIIHLLTSKTSIPVYSRIVITGTTTLFLLEIKCRLTNNSKPGMWSFATLSVLRSAFRRGRLQDETTPGQYPLTITGEVIKHNS